MRSGIWVRGGRGAVRTGGTTLGCGKYRIAWASYDCLTAATVSAAFFSNARRTSGGSLPVPNPIKSAGILSAEAIAWTCSSVGIRLPDSTWLRKLLVTPSVSASCAWDRPMASRCRRIAAPADHANSASELSGGTLNSEKRGGVDRFCQPSRAQCRECTDDYAISRLRVG
jgi:hypothetical protein